MPPRVGPVARGNIATPSGLLKRASAILPGTVHFPEDALLGGLTLLFALLAAPPPVALDWSAPEGCPDRAAVLAELERVWTLAPAGRVRPLQVGGAITRGGESYRLDLELAGDGRPVTTRSFADPSCAGFAQVAALVIALASTPDRAPAPASPPPAPDEPPPRFVARVLLAGDFGTLVRPTPGVGLGFGGRLGRTRLEGRLQYWFTQAADGLETSLVSAGLGACAVLTRGLELGLCLGLDGGRLEARARDTGLSTRGAWLAMLPGASVGWGFAGGFGVQFDLALGLTLLAPNVRGLDPQGRGPADVFARGALSLEWRLR